MHLFFLCNFSKQCWNTLDIHWNSQSAFFNMIIEAKQTANLQFFMEILIIAAWNIWKQRNNKIFENKTPSLQAWKKGFKDDLCETYYD
ncbi:hypothetical protein EJB05_40345, partial [Eragrostis curvula]